MLTAPSSLLTPNSEDLQESEIGFILFPKIHKESKRLKKSQSRLEKVISKPGSLELRGIYFKGT